MVIDHSERLPNKLSQYLLRPESTEALSLTVEDLIKQRLRTPCTSPCNAPILPIKRPNGQGWRCVQDLRAINKTVILRFPVFQISTPCYLTTESKWFTVVDLCSAFFSSPVDSEKQYYLSSFRKINNIPGL